MSASAPLNSRLADKRVAVPIMLRPAVEKSALPRAAAPRGARSSLLNNMTLQEDAAVSSPVKKSVPPESARITPIGFLCRDSEEDGANPVQDPIGTRTGNVSPARPSFSTDTGPNVKWIGGHYIRVSGIKEANVAETQKLLNAQFDWNKKLLGARTVGKEMQTMYLRFDSIDHAAEAFPQVSMVLSSLETDYVLFHEYAAAEDGAMGDCHFYDGQVIFVAEFVGQISQLNTADVDVELEQILEVLGKVLVFAPAGQTSYSLEFRVEFDKISVARTALDTMCPETPYNSEKHWKITTKEMVDPLKKKISQSALQQKTELQEAVIQSPSGRTAWTQDANGNVHVEKPVTANPVNAMALVPYQQQQVFPVMYTAEPNPAFDNHGLRPQPHQQTRDHYQKTEIHLDKIRQGRDVRTTIMLRNIPNSWGYQTLKDRLDEFCFGLYDFSYLRIDFSKHNNVGYGFMNFTRAMDIVPLYEGLFQKPWARGGKKRNCILSYATVQGIDCLVEKFRNSSVQNEAPPFNAKRWWTYFDVENSDIVSQSQSSSSSDTQMVKHTGDTPHIVTPTMVGTERPFDLPNNEFKHQRSNDNATQCDLWAGQRGRGRGGIHRGGYSNWDRGTTHQMQEDMMYGMPMQVSYVQVAPQFMMHPYYQQYNGAGNGGNHDQHHNGQGYANNHQQYQNGSRVAPHDGWVSNDARNDARVPRSLGHENLQASQPRARFNQRGGRIYG